jgi:hypothetical protein
MLRTDQLNYINRTQCAHETFDKSTFQAKQDYHHALFTLAGDDLELARLIFENVIFAARNEFNKSVISIEQPLAIK